MRRRYTRQGLRGETEEDGDLIFSVEDLIMAYYEHVQQSPVSASELYEWSADRGEEVRDVGNRPITKNRIHRVYQYMTRRAPKGTYRNLMGDTFKVRRGFPTRIHWTGKDPWMDAARSFALEKLSEMPEGEKQEFAEELLAIEGPGGPEVYRKLEEESPGLLHEHVPGEVSRN